MIAGIQYYPKSKNGTNYKVVSRFHMFQVSDHGLYCNSLLELECYNVIINYIKKNKYEKYVSIYQQMMKQLLES